MGTLVFQATLGGQVNLTGPNTASTFTISVPAVTGTMITSGDTATVTSSMISGPITTAKGGTGLTSFTANGIVYASSTSALATGSALTFDGTKLAITNSGEQLRLIGNGTTGYIRATDGTNNLWYIGQGGAAGLQLFTYDTNPIGFYVNATEQMRLTSTGLGIGTSSPGAKLEVAAGTGSIFAKFTSSNADPYLKLQNTSAAGKDWILYSSGTGSGTAGALRFFNNTDNITAVTIDSAGNLGLGVTPSAWGSIFRAEQIGNYGAFIAGRTDSSNQLHLGTNSYYNGTNWIYTNTAPATRYVLSSGNHEFYTAASGTAGNAITFTQAMTLDASGNLLVGKTAPSNINKGATIGQDGQLNIILTTAGGGSQCIFLNRQDTTGDAILFRQGNGTVGSISVTGSTTSYNITSDQRLKENIQDAESSSALIDALQVRQFDWKTDNTHQRYGFIAQELVTVAPEAVHQPVNEEEMMAVDYSKLVPMLVKEIQSLRKRLAAAGI